MNGIKTGLGMTPGETHYQCRLCAQQKYPAVFLPFLSWPVDFADRCSGGVV